MTSLQNTDQSCSAVSSTNVSSPLHSQLTEIDTEGWVGTRASWSIQTAQGYSLWANPASNHPRIRNHLQTHDRIKLPPVTTEVLQYSKMHCSPDQKITDVWPKFIARHNSTFSSILPHTVIIFRYVPCLWDGNLIWGTIYANFILYTDYIYIYKITYKIFLYNFIYIYIFKLYKKILYVDYAFATAEN